MVYTHKGPVELVHVYTNARGDAYATELLDLVGRGRFSNAAIAQYSLETAWGIIRGRRRLGSMASPRIDLVEVGR